MSVALDSTSRILQDSIYDYIVSYMQSHQGLPPTIREISAACHCASTSHVDYHISRLEKRGLITRQPHMSRGITLRETLVVAQVMQASQKILHVRAIHDGKAYRGRLYLEDKQ